MTAYSKLSPKTIRTLRYRRQYARRGGRWPGKAWHQFRMPLKPLLVTPETGAVVAGG